MSVEDTLKINQKVELVIKSGSGIGSYRSRVEEISKENFQVATPFSKGYMINFRPGEEIEINYVYNNDAVYTFDTYILESRINPIPVLVLAKPTSFRRIQRRNYVRLNTRLDVTINKLAHQVELVVKSGPYLGQYQTQIKEIDESLLKIYLPMEKERFRFLPLTHGTEIAINLTFPNGEVYTFVDQVKGIVHNPVPVFTVEKPIIIRRQGHEEALSLPMDFKQFEVQYNNRLIKGETKDISGGGLSFNSAEPFSNGDILDIRVDLPTGGQIRAFGEVVLVKKQAGFQGIYENCIKFTHIYEGERDKIIQYIFQRQLELRRKGLL